MAMTPEQIDAAEAAALGILTELDDLIDDNDATRPFFGWGWNEKEPRTADELTPVGRIAFERLTTYAAAVTA